MKISNSREDLLVTYSLGSCLGMTLYDPVARIGGMIHCMLPLSKIDTVKASNNPAMFTDTGVIAILQAIYDMGADRKRLIVKIAGCSNLMDEKGLFRIGERNCTVLRKMLWKNNILIAGEDVGGSVSRTMSLHMDAGRTTIKSGGIEKDL